MYSCRVNHCTAAYPVNSLFGTWIALTLASSPLAKAATVHRFRMPSLLIALPLAGLWATPAFAAGGSVQLPEPSALVLLSMGVSGVVLGRRFSRKKPRD